ncbi:MAG: prephenate dehydratase domain-containing protein [Duodenibacillus massiliensis]
MENSSQGTVTRTMDLLFFLTPIHYRGSAHSDCAQPHEFHRKKEDIEVVSAHPQALAQCRAWLGTHLPGVKTIPAASNAEAALEASKKPKMAAIAATRAAELYGLQIVSAGIQDDPRNRTRFLVLGHAVAAKGSAGSDKTSVVFSVPNRAGQLFHALEPLEKNGVSMMRLESRPARNGAWDYNFFVDVEGHATDAKVAQALAEMKEVSSFLRCSAPTRRPKIIKSGNRKKIREKEHE